MKGLICYAIVINVIAFVMFGIDKEKAKRHQWRISEAALLGAAAVGGSVGALAGMQVFHHKTKKPKFVFGVPAILLLHVVLCWKMFA